MSEIGQHRQFLRFYVYSTGDEAGLKALLTELRDHEKAREISDWDIGGQLILDFINLTHELQVRNELLNFPFDTQ